MDGMTTLQFPRAHLFIVVILTFGLSSFVIAKFTDDPAEDRFTTESVLLDLPKIEDEALSGQEAIVNEAITPAVAELAMLPPRAAEPEPRPQPQWQEISTKVQPGDNLALIQT